MTDRLRKLPIHEWVNGITHGVGLALSVAALVVLVVVAQDWTSVVGSLLFGAGLTTLYLASTLYHLARKDKLKEKLRLFDHIAILYLIAGSYAPFAMHMGDLSGYAMLVIVWILALGGTVFKLMARKHRYHNAGTLIYVVMGWMAVFFAGPLVSSLPSGAMAWLVAGGVAYTAGIAFYLWERWDYAHGVWHLFVLAGSACHVVAAYHVAVH